MLEITPIQGLTYGSFPLKHFVKYVQTHSTSPVELCSTGRRGPVGYSITQKCAETALLKSIPKQHITFWFSHTEPPDLEMFNILTVSAHIHCSANEFLYDFLIICVSVSHFNSIGDGGLLLVVFQMLMLDFVYTSSTIPIVNHHRSRNGIQPFQQINMKYCCIDFCSQNRDEWKLTIQKSLFTVSVETSKVHQSVHRLQLLKRLSALGKWSNWCQRDVLVLKQSQVTVY